MEYARFASDALSTVNKPRFVYDTLDVCTRLARHILQELAGSRSRASGLLAALISLIIPFLFLMFTKDKGYLVAWPIFGTSNQLLASLILLALSVWLIKSGRNPIYTLVPMVFMMVMTVWSLVTLTTPFYKALPSIAGGGISSDIVISGICGSILLGLSLALVWEAAKTLVRRRTA
ncbi:MAG: carbon starvation CstA 5TM domain-containing protein [Candidatus Eisenbacteria bacterium]